MLETIGAFFNSFPAWLVAVTTVVTACSAIVALTPTPKDDAVLAKVLKVLNALALNFGAAKKP